MAINNNELIIKTGLEDFINKEYKNWTDKQSGFFDKMNDAARNLIRHLSPLHNQLSSSSSSSSIYKSYTTNHGTVQYEQLIKQATLLIEQFRAEILNQETIVSVGILYNRQYYLTTFSYAELLARSKLTYSSTSDIVLKSGLKEVGNKTTLLIAAEKKGSKILLGSAETINKKLKSYRKDESLNQGQVWEAYQLWKANNNKMNIQTAISQAKNNIVGFKGGDVFKKVGKRYESIQVKFWGKSDFSIVKLTTIIDYLGKIINICSLIKSKQKTAAVNKIKKEFLDETAIGAARMARSEASKSVDDYFKNFIK